MQQAHNNLQQQPNFHSDDSTGMTDTRSLYKHSLAATVEDFLQKTTRHVWQQLMRHSTHCLKRQFSAYKQNWSSLSLSVHYRGRTWWGLHIYISSLYLTEVISSFQAISTAVQGQGRVSADGVLGVWRSSTLNCSTTVKSVVVIIVSQRVRVKAAVVQRRLEAVKIYDFRRPAASWRNL